MTLTIEVFAEWLAQQRLRDDPVGDLARDAAEDAEWPPMDVPPVDYLRRRGACDGAIEAMNTAIIEFEDSLK